MGELEAIQQLVGVILEDRYPTKDTAGRKSTDSSREKLNN